MAGDGNFLLLEERALESRTPSYRTHESPRRFANVVDDLGARQPMVNQRNAAEGESLPLEAAALLYGQQLEIPVARRHYDLFPGPESAQCGGSQRVEKGNRVQIVEVLNWIIH